MQQRSSFSTWVEIDLDVFEQNLRVIRDAIGANSEILLVVKADAYGMGLLACAETVLRSGADGLSLSNMDDAVRLRRSGITQPILVYAGATIGTGLALAVTTFL